MAEVHLVDDCNDIIVAFCLGLNDVFLYSLACPHWSAMSSAAVNLFVSIP